MIKKTSLRDSAASPSGKMDSEKKLAPHFKPSGTYVIKSVDHDLFLDDAKDHQRSPSVPPRESGELRDSFDSKENEIKVEIKTGNTAASTDPPEDIEEVELKNELKTQTKSDKSHSAWSEESQNQLTSPKPPLLPKPVFYSKPSTANDDIKKKSPSPKKSEDFSKR